MPLQVTGIKNAKSLALQGAGACAVDGTAVKCWGNGNNRRLGDYATYTQYSPVRAEAANLKKPTALWTSNFGSCEIGDSGRMHCWGDGGDNRLGNGQSSAGYTETVVSGMGYVKDPTSVRILNTAPGKPKATSTAARTVKLTWTAPSTSNGTSAPKDYIIEYRLKGATKWTTYKDSVSSAKSVTVKNLTRGKQYQFRVTPKNWAGKGTASAASAYVKVK